MRNGGSPVIFNVLCDDWDDRRSSPGYAWSRTGVGRRLGGELLGASLNELRPGQRSWPYHFHHGNEEMMIVLDGAPTLRTQEGFASCRAVTQRSFGAVPRAHTSSSTALTGRHGS